VRKKKQIVVSEGELRQQQARASPVPPSLLQRVVNTVRRGNSGAHSTAQLISSLKEEVFCCSGFNDCTDTGPVCLSDQLYS
jgi:hypothetical protein